MTDTVECRELGVAADDVVLLPETSFTLTGPALVALTGANGTGKTTLLKTVAGRQLPSSGQCLVNSEAPYEFAPQFRAAVASLIDTPPMARDMTLLEQLALVNVSWGEHDDAAFSTADRVLEQLTIPELGERFPYELSAGQLQLFAIALTLSRPFSILLLDEPERHLDSRRVEVLLQMLEDRVGSGALIITATHREELMERAGQHIHLERCPETE